MRRKENLRILSQRRLTEVNKRDRSRINKRKYYGVGVEIREYFQDIYNTFYDKDQFKALVNNQQSESLEDDFQKYMSNIEDKIKTISTRIRSFLLKSFEKGSKRVQDKDGETITSGKIEDTRAVDFLLNQQKIYLKGLTDDQNKRAFQIIAKGRNEGKPSLEISKDLQKGVQKLTKARANTIARTEIVKSHNMGQVQLMKELGVETYRYLTANDNNVAKICKKNQGPKGREKIYQLAKAGTPSNPLPVINSHPNCRCTIVVNGYHKLS